MANIKSPINRFLKPVFIIALLLAFITTAAVVGAQDNNLKPAIKAYSEGNYQKTIDLIKALDRKSVSVNDQLAHYYNGLSYQQLKQNAAAKNEYMWVYQKSTDQKLRYKAWLGLKSLSSNTAAKASSTAKASSSSVGDGWVLPGKDYGKSGPAATASKEVTIIPTSCGKRHR